MRILYVEDNETNQALVGRVVRAKQHSIVFREEGEGALDILATDAEIDLVLLDIELAGAISGLDVVKTLRARKDKRPVVAVTAYAMMGDRERILAAGCDQYLPKPLVITDLLAMMDHYETELAARRDGGIAAQPEAAPATDAVQPADQAVDDASKPAAEPAEPVATEAAKPAASEAAKPAADALAERPAAETKPDKPAADVPAVPPAAETKPDKPAAPPPEAAVPAASPEPATAPAPEPVGVVGPAAPSAQDKPAGEKSS